LLTSELIYERMPAVCDSNHRSVAEPLQTKGNHQVHRRCGGFFRPLRGNLRGSPGETYKKYDVFRWHVHCKPSMHRGICRRSFHGVRMTTMRILIGYNGTDFASAALDELKQAGLPHRAKALVMTVAEMCFATVDRDDAGRLAAIGAGRLQNIFPGWDITTSAATGAAAGEIMAGADRFQPDLIVLGERIRSNGTQNIFLGPVSQRILTEAPCSVHIGRGKSVRPDSPIRLLVGFDGSAGAEHAIRSIASRNWPAGTSVRLLSVADSFVMGSIGRFAPQINNAVVEERFATQWAETLARDSLELLRDTGLEASVEVRMGHPKHTLVDYADQWRADCIFVGPHCAGNSFERFLLGSVSSAVAARANCSVEVVRSPSDHFEM
jgi:nucleotide-binding universal stress UspA family protein